MTSLWKIGIYCICALFYTSYLTEKVFVVWFMVCMFLSTVDINFFNILYLFLSWWKHLILIYILLFSLNNWRYFSDNILNFGLYLWNHFSLINILFLSLNYWDIFPIYHNLISVGLLILFLFDLNIALLFELHLYIGFMLYLI